MDIPWLTPISRIFLERDYLLPGQTPEQRMDIICDNAERILKMPGFSAKFKANLHKGWYSLASPIWANFGSSRGLPISCFGSHIEDSMESILRTHAEIGIMSKYGGGTSAYFGELRKRGSKINQNGESSGSVHFMHMFDNLIQVVSQGATRRGQCAAYLPIDHGDIDEFLTIRTDASKVQNLSTGVCVTDDWMKAMIGGDEPKRKVWAKVLTSRAKTGYPYIFFTDNANRGKPACYINKKITHSNLCTEIMLPDDADESFVCDLSSMNVLHFDEWKDTDAVQLLTFFLDAVMTEFIEKAQHLTYMERPVRFAQRHRALGIGWLGWHSYLQSKMIPFESMRAKLMNTMVAETIRNQATQASRTLATLFGEPDVLRGTGLRNTTLTAIAPTKSSAFILGQVSEGIEPNLTNFYIKDLQKGKFTIKNPYLEKLLDSKQLNIPLIWDSILKHGGSVQHLTCLDETEKAVFKTFAEIAPREVVIQAAMRQKYIDQGQSLNLMIHPSIPVKDVNALMIEAWRLGVKSLYYQNSVNAAQEFSRNILACSSCEA